jgi:adenosylmethionine-8-amino-7-oxononanoate aminotransferase
MSGCRELDCVQRWASASAITRTSATFADAACSSRLELVEDRESRRPFPRARKLAESIRVAALARGLVCYPSSGTADGDIGDHVLLAPPYIVNAREIDEIVDKLDAALAAVLEEKKP